MSFYNIGDTVSWGYEGEEYLDDLEHGRFTATILEYYYKPVTITVNNHTITRDGSDEDPAYLLRDEATGIETVRLHSELEPEP